MIYYNYFSYIEDVSYLAEKIRTDFSRKGRPKNLYPILRGGAVIASFLSLKLHIPIVTLKRYVKVNGTLIVDDIIDTGKVRNIWKDFNFASLHVKEGLSNDLYPTYFSKKVENENIIYWWEEYANENCNIDHRSS